MSKYFLEINNQSEIERLMKYFPVKDFGFFERLEKSVRCYLCNSSIFDKLSLNHLFNNSELIPVELNLEVTSLSFYLPEIDLDTLKLIVDQINKEFPNSIRILDSN
jgi:hypothetical protein